MTLGTFFKANIPESELPRSQSLGRQLAQALAIPMDFKSYAMHRLKVGTVLLKSGDLIKKLPFVMSGRLDVIVHVPGSQGGQIVPITFRAGEIGLLSYLFNHLPSGGDLVANEQSVIKWIAAQDIEAELLKNADLLILLVRFLGNRLREVQERERALSTRGAKARLCAGLSRILADLPPREDGRLLIELTHEQLASRCGLSRPKTSVALKKMEQEGVVRPGRKWIDVLNPDALRSNVG